MATAASATRADLGADAWVTIPASWESYVRLLADRGERARPRYIFLDERLTAVSPGIPHEFYKERLGGLIHELLAGLGVPYRASGAVTLFKAVASREGTEADLSYYLTNLDVFVPSRERLVMGVDPPPDLMVDVVVSHPEDDALEVYGRFGVREVWVLRESGLEFLAPDQDGRYVPSATSRLLPFLAPDDLTPWLFRDDAGDQGALSRAYRVWVADTLAPRRAAENP